VIIIPSWGRTKAFLDKIPHDIALIMIWLSMALFIEYLLPTTVILIKAIIILPLILFIPGYLVLMFLFPVANDLSGMERLVISVVFSVSLVPILVFSLNFTTQGIVLDSVLTALSLMILLFAMLVVIRRLLIPEEDQFSLIRWGMMSTGAVPSVARDRRERRCLILLAGTVLLFVIITALMIGIPREGEHYTEFYLLGADQTMTNLSYPDSTMALSNGSYSVWIVVKNHEFRTIPYTIEVMEVNSTVDPLSNTTLIQNVSERSAFTLTVQHNQTVQAYTQVNLNQSSNMLQFLLFLGDPPDSSVGGEDRVNRSYRHLDLKK